MSTGSSSPQAIELGETGRGQYVLKPIPVLLWVDAQSYLPIRVVSGSASANGGVTVSRPET